MVVKVYKNYEDVSRTAADIFKAALIENPKSVLGLATGSTPVGMYRELARQCREGLLSFADASSYNLDEYVGIDMDHPESYHSFMKRELFDHVDFKAGHTHVPWTSGTTAEQDCAEYDRRIAEAGGIDLQILGIGGNGHIAFNEPSDVFTEETHITNLDERTVRDNARFFDSPESVPTRAMTVGMGVIMGARRILMLATGRNKAEAVRKMLRGPITPRVPASILRLHRQMILLLDEEAAGDLNLI